MRFEHTRYMVVTGTGRIATAWLASMLDQHPDCRCEWEPFDKSTWPAGFEQWARPDAPLVAMISPIARDYVPEIEARCKPLWVFGWRPVYETLWSTARRHCRLDLPDLAAWLYGGVERALAFLSTERADVHNWRWDYYTTPKGFAALTRLAGLSPYEYTWQASVNTSADPLKVDRVLDLPPPEDWSNVTKANIRRAIAPFRRVRKALLDLWELEELAYGET